jgi:hypothetical protein
VLRGRITSFARQEPWIEAALGVGVRAASCPASLATPSGLVCFFGEVLPLGVRWRRGAVSHGEVVPTPTTADYAAIVAVGAEVRWPAEP